MQARPALLASEPAVRAEAVRRYDEEPAAAVSYLTGRALALQQAALADAKEMFGGLVWYVAEHNNARKYSMNYHTHVLTPFKSQQPYAVRAKALLSALCPERRNIDGGEFPLLAVPTEPGRGEVRRTAERSETAEGHEDERRHVAAQALFNGTPPVGIVVDRPDGRGAGR